MSSPRLSFIIPVYRPDLAVFTKALKALRAQSFRDFEVILVLDGPDEAARQAAEKVLLGSNPPATVRTIDHGGACAARNAGAELARGEFLVFWDCDCVIEPHTAQAWVDSFDRHPEAGFVYSGYRFLEERGGIASEPFDPWTLRVRNYISACFPVRRQFAAPWDPALASLQDWDFWLSVVERGANGRFIPGYAFATAYPTPTSISGQGCRPEVWLERMDAVRRKHGLPARDVCVAAIGNHIECVRLAKLLDADYQDIPNDKPNHYRAIIQVGFSLVKDAGAHAFVFRDARTVKHLFWTAENILDLYHRVSLIDIQKTAALLNRICARQFVEDKPAAEMMKAAGFEVTVLPLPLTNTDQSPALPGRPRWLVETSHQYGAAFVALEKSLPDIVLDVPTTAANIEEYTGVLHFMPDRTMTATVKRALLTGRHVISNIEQPYTGFVNDTQKADLFIPAMVEKVRALSRRPTNPEARAYYEKALSPDRLRAALAGALPAEAQ